MSEELKVKQVVKYGGHTLQANGGVKLTLVAQYSQLGATLELTPMLNEDIEILARATHNAKPLRLGSFRIKQLVIDGDGESKLKFDSMTDFVEVDNLNLLPLRNDEVPEFTVLYRCVAEDINGSIEDGD